MKQLIILFLLLTFLCLTGCVDRDKLNSLSDEINTQQSELQSLQNQFSNINEQMNTHTNQCAKQIEDINNGVSSIETGLNLLKGSLVAAEVVLTKLDADLMGIRAAHPIISQCILENGIWSGIAAMATSNNSDDQATGMAVAVTCTFATAHDDYDYVKERLSDINLKIITANAVVSKLRDEVSETTQSLNNAIDEAAINISDLETKRDDFISDCKEQLADLDSKISDTKDTLNVLNDYYECENNIFCRLKTKLL